MQRLLNFFIGALVGALVGATAAILLAPTSGEELRIQIQDRGNHNAETPSPLVEDPRRAKRYNDFIPFCVKPDGKDMKAGWPASGRIINISRCGACLLLPIGSLDPYKVYRTIFRDTSSFLEIQGTVSPETFQFTLAGRPVWTDPFIMDELRVFKMGIEFMGDPEGARMNALIKSIQSK